MLWKTTTPVPVTLLTHTGVYKKGNANDLLAEAAEAQPLMLEFMRRAIIPFPGSHFDAVPPKRRENRRKSQERIRWRVRQSRGCCAGIGGVPKCRGPRQAHHNPVG